MGPDQKAEGKIYEFTSTLREVVQGEVRTDVPTRVLYSTDASIYQIEPLGVFFPRNLDDISRCVELANEYMIPILPRGSGTSLAGQAIGPGLIIDCSRHLERIISLDPESKTAVVEPGVILSTLNKTAGRFGLQFGPDPASAERATIGGVIGNNATGAHSIRYGMSADHVLSMDVVLSDGTISKFKPFGLDIARDKIYQASVEGNIYRAALDIRNDYAKAIQEDWPQTWRRSSGYNLNYLLPWSPSIPPQWSNQLPYPPTGENQLNLAQLIAGSEGTLGIFHEAEVNLVPKPKYTTLVLLAFPNVVNACGEVEEILAYQPSAVELIPENMLRLAGTIPFYAQQINFLKQIIVEGNDVPDLLVVEFAGDNPDQITNQSGSLLDRYSSIAHAVDDPDLQERIWKVRKVGLGLLMSISGDVKPITFIEDLSVPVTKLSQFVSELGKIMAEHNSEGDFYAHASAGCLHLRPLINIKTGDGIKKMRRIAQEAVDLVISLGGVPSGEHGDGIARSEWLDAVFGPRIGEANKRLKEAADPKSILNPGKIIEPLPMDDNLRYGVNYSSKSWKTNLDFAKQDGFAGAIELCNGAGVCRKLDGVMCPSYQVTKEEMHSTRGRANLLRAMISNNVPDRSVISDGEVYEALDLCLACKGCKAECPSGVDMAKLKYEFIEHYYSSSKSNRHPARDYMFGYIHTLSKIGLTFSPITNFLLEEINQVGFLKNKMGVSGKRKLPQLSRSTLHALFKNKNLDNSYPQPEKVLFLSDPFTEYYQPDIGMAAIDILYSTGCHVELIPIIGSGRTLISKGFIKSARKHAEKVVEAINSLDFNNHTSIVGVEPSEIYTLRDEYTDFFPGSEAVKSIAERAFMIDEFMIRPGTTQKPRNLRIVNNYNDKIDNQKILLHGHCYQKSQPPAADGYPIGVQATVELLERVGFDVELIDSGCCGMAGAFGYESEHYDISMKIGEISLFPQIRQKSEDSVVAASGFSCMTQIKDATEQEAQHPISLIHRRLLSPS